MVIGADAVTAAGSIMLSIVLPPLSAGSREGSNDGFWSRRDSREGKVSSVLVLLLPLLVVVLLTNDRVSAVPGVSPLCSSAKTASNALRQQRQ